MKLRPDSSRIPSSRHAARALRALRRSGPLALPHAASSTPRARSAAERAERGPPRPPPPAGGAAAAPPTALALARALDGMVRDARAAAAARTPRSSGLPPLDGAPLGPPCDRARRAARARAPRTRARATTAARGRRARRARRRRAPRGGGERLATRGARRARARAATRARSRTSFQEQLCAEASDVAALFGSEPRGSRERVVGRRAAVRVHTLADRPRARARDAARRAALYCADGARMRPHARAGRRAAAEAGLPLARAERGERRRARARARRGRGRSRKRWHVRAARQARRPRYCDGRVWRARATTRASCSAR